MARFRISFVSDSVKDVMEILVVVPQKKHVCSSKSPEIQLGSFQKEYPVLILLHDEASSPQELLDLSCVERFANQMGIMLVVPQGVLSYWTDYTERDRCVNEANSSGASSIENNFTEMCYGTYVMDVLHYVRRILPGSLERPKTYIGGIGMGGFGALKLAMKHPETFSAVFSVSGDVDLQWKMDHQPERREQFQSIFGGLLAEGENNLPKCCKKMAVSKDVPDMMLLWDRAGESAVMNRNLIKALDGCYKGLAAGEMDGPYDWEYVDKALYKALHWLNTRKL